MRILFGENEKIALNYLNKACEIARKSTCLRAKCGSIIINDNYIIGMGFNSPPRELESQRKCLDSKETLDKKISDETCCVHAEQRAIFNALKNYPKAIEGSVLYFARVDKSFKLESCGEPYCTICSKSALDVGIKEFVLHCENEIRVYCSEE